MICWEEEKKIKIAVIGGDKREEVMIRCLAEAGHSITVLSDKEYTHPNITSYTDLKKVVKDHPLIIAPMSNTDQKGVVKSTFVESRVQLTEDFFGSLDKKALFFIGIAKPIIKKYLENSSIQYIETAKIDELAILNAIPTAEGAIKIAIEESDITIHDSKIITYGLGKVGLSLAWRLKALGAISYAVTRDRAAIARGKDMGIQMLTYDQLEENLPEMDIVFNTVPAKIINRESIALMKKSAVIIDLASAPGGVDFKAAKEMGIKSVLALGLPGKDAPVTAGKILAEIIPDIINKL